MWQPIDADFPDILRSDASRPERISDHDALVASFSFPKADLSLTKAASASTVLARGPMSYTLTVVNSMDDAAAAAAQQHT